MYLHETKQKKSKQRAAKSKHLPSVDFNHSRRSAFCLRELKSKFQMDFERSLTERKCKMFVLVQDWRSVTSKMQVNR